MYERVLLAYDGSREGRTALREGALLARRFGSRVYLLCVVAETPGVRIGEAAYAGAIVQTRDTYSGLFEEAMTRLRELGSTDRTALDRLLDDSRVGHFGLAGADGRPVVIPTAIARDGTTCANSIVTMTTPGSQIASARRVVAIGRFSSRRASAWVGLRPVSSQPK